jgi:hypothetical protein
MAARIAEPERPANILGEVGVKPYSDLSLKNFFERPVKIDNFIWANSNAANTIVWSSSISSALESVDMWVKKYDGYRNVRGTAVLRVQVNAQPFQQGRLLLHFLPVASHMDSGVTMTPYVKMHNFDLVTKTQQPNVELDCRDASCVLRIPYSTPTQWYDTKDNLYDWGTAYLSVLSPITDAATASADVTVWLSFEDFEMCAPYYPQSSSGANLRGRTPRRSNQSEEVDKMQSNSISSALSTVSSGLSIVSGIPVLSTFTEPAAWAAKFASNIAAALGYSKPIMDLSVSPLAIRPYRNFANSEGLTAGESLGLVSNPSVATMVGTSGTSVDEMSFDFVKQVPAFAKAYSWSTSDAEDTAIFGMLIGPDTIPLKTLHSEAVTTDTTKYLTGAPFICMAQKFQYWRGSIRITLKFIKTQYHSGRVLIDFQPITRITENGPNNLNSAYILREIVDIRESSEITLELPYLHNSEYLPVHQVSGYLSVRVLNQLKAPSTVASTVSVLAFCSGGPDFELQFPALEDRYPFTPQMDVSPTTTIVNKPIGDSIVGGRDTIHAQACMGDNFEHVSQIISRFSQVLQPYAVSGTSNNAALASNQKFSFFPFFMGSMKAAASYAAGADGAQLMGDNMSYFGSAYAYQRGSVMIAVTSSSNDSMVYGQAVATSKQFSENQYTYMYMDASDPALSGKANLAGSGGTISENSPSPGVAVIRTRDGPIFTCPMYHLNPVRLNQFFAQSQAYTNTLWQQGFNVHFQITGSVAPTDQKLFRAAGDDFRFTYFIGFPPIAYSF